MKDGDPRFLGGVAQFKDVDSLRLPAKPRVAFVGRSNVGKSSLLNALTSSQIARVSQRPGKTQEINYFLWKHWLLVDLPGYGYAKVGHEKRSIWGREIPRFLREDPMIGLVVSLIDGNVGFTADDDEMIGFLSERQFPALVVFTKMDKHKSSNQRRNRERELAKQAEARGVENFVFVSAEKGENLGRIKEIFRELL